ncbi:MAG: hypothetical protein LBR79_05250 [Oscillospiraceae bacterium]|nr:hypothetical protein [Oscillospiraceae bacterium]
MIISFTPACGGGERKNFNCFETRPKNASLKKWLCIKISLEYFYTPSSILIAICKVYGQIY